MNEPSEWVEVRHEPRYVVRDAAAGPYTVSHTSLRKGQSTRGHDHERDEVYAFIGGTGRMTVGDDRFDVRFDSVVYVPPGAFHRVENMTAIAGQSLRFFSFFVGAPGRPA